MIGSLCHKYGDYRLAHSTDGNLIYKTRETPSPSTLPGWTKITIEWFSSDRDLDILGFWSSDPSKKLGWSWGDGPFESGMYQSRWSGDDTSESGTETLDIWMSSFPRNSETYLIYFNFYGEGTSCNVYVEQDGKTLYKNQSCGHNSSHRAETSDPSCRIVFTSDGKISRLL